MTFLCGTARIYYNHLFSKGVYYAVLSRSDECMLCSVYCTDPKRFQWNCDVKHLIMMWTVAME